MSEKSLKIKAFRAVDEPELSKAYLEGHTDVLTSYNVPKVTSATEGWIHNPDVFVIAIIDQNQKMVGGGKIHVKNDANELPIEAALGHHQDFGLWIKKFEGQRVGEMCGLWNAKKVAGSGISLVVLQSLVAKIGLTITNQLKLNIMIGLCSPWTLPVVQELGLRIVKEIGNQGSYPYPKDDLPATVTAIEDTDTFTNATEEQRERIFDLRHKPIQHKLELIRGNRLDIDYDLIIPNLEITWL